MTAHRAGVRRQPRPRLLLLRRQGRAAGRARRQLFQNPDVGLRGGDPRGAARAPSGRRASSTGSGGLGRRPRQPDALRAAAARAARPGGPGAVRRGVPRLPRGRRGLPGVRAARARPTRRLDALAAVSIAVVEGLGIQRALDPEGFDHERAWRVWRDVIGRLPAAARRLTAPSRLTPTPDRSQRAATSPTTRLDTAR